MEVLAVVLQMASNTIFAVGIAHLKVVVVSVLGAEILRDFLVAIQALKGGRAGAELVAVRTLRCPGKRLVRF